MAIKIKLFKIKLECEHWLTIFNTKSNIKRIRQKMHSLFCSECKKGKKIKYFEEMTIRQELNGVSE